MSKQTMTLLTLLLGGLLLAAGAQAGHVLIIESSSINPSHVQDTHWLGAAYNMGHTAAIVPQTTLDNTNYIATTDLLIVSSGVIYLPPNRVANIQAMMEAGKPVYLQCEYPMIQSTTQAFETIVDNLGNPFAWFDWVADTPSSLNPMEITGTLSFDPNFVSSLSTFNGGCRGDGEGISSHMYHQFVDHGYGYTFYPPGGVYGMIACNTDQDWALSDPLAIDLMENYIDLLFDYGGGSFIWLGIEPVNTSVGPSGGSISYNARVMNPGPSLWSGDAWAYALLPNGNYHGPLFVNYGLNFPPDAVTPVIYRSHYVPAFAPVGTYTFFAYLGTYPSSADITRTFDFYKTTVSPNGAGGPPVEEWGGDDWAVFAGDATATSESAVTPDEFELGAAYPNPFNPSTTLNLILPEAAVVDVSVFNVAGQRVATLAEGSHAAGSHQLSFDASGLSGGVYFVRASAGSWTAAQKIVLTK